MTQSEQKLPTPGPKKQQQTPETPEPSPLGRRLAGIGALFACALVVDPARVVPDATSLSQIDTAIALQALVIPALAALGLWLVLPKLNVLAICVLALAGAHSELGSSDLFSGYLYPALTAGAAVFLVQSFRRAL